VDVLGRLRRDEGGFGLVEILIALTILAIAILAIFAGFSSGMLALQRAGRASTGATLADKKMEEFRRLQYSAIATGSTADTPTGADGRTYWRSTDVSYTCVISGSTLDTSTTPPTCSTVAGVASRPVKLVTIIVRDGTATARVLMRETSTFDESTGT
jgi:type II secretory pathway pseudopilin PulG